MSNMPVYVLGSYIKNSKVSSGAGAMTETPWMRALIAGDQVTPGKLSEALAGLARFS